MAQRMMLIINPISGTGDKSGLSAKIVNRLGASGIHVDVENTKCRGDATRLARQGVDMGYDAVLACGGDGTVNETARAMLGTGVAMGIIPNGSGNGLARHLGIPIDPLLSLDIIAEGNTRSCDCGTVNNRPFFCTFGVGFDAAVSDRFAASGKRGKISYIRSAIEEFIRYRHEQYTLHVDGKIITDDAFLIACCNASQYGNNAYIAPHASVTDGLLDLIVVRKASLIETMMVGIDLISGTIDQNRIIDTIRVRNAVIERTSAGSAHIDGEPVSLGETLNVKCHPGLLRLFVPTDKPEFKPIITPFEDTIRDITVTIRNLVNSL